MKSNHYRNGLLVPKICMKLSLDLIGNSSQKSTCRIISHSDVYLICRTKDGMRKGSYVGIIESYIVSDSICSCSGEKAKTGEWPTMVEVKGRVRLSAFGKFVKELPLSRSRVLMVYKVYCVHYLCSSISTISFTLFCYYYYYTSNNRSTKSHLNIASPFLLQRLGSPVPIS